MEAERDPEPVGRDADSLEEGDRRANSEPDAPVAEERPERGRAFRVVVGLVDDGAGLADLLPPSGRIARHVGIPADEQHGAGPVRRERLHQRQHIGAVLRVRGRPGRGETGSEQLVEADPRCRAGARGDRLREERVRCGRHRRGVGRLGRLTDDVREMEDEIRRRRTVGAEVPRDPDPAARDDDVRAREHRPRVRLDRPLAVVDPHGSGRGQPARVDRSSARSRDTESKPASGRQRDGEPGGVASGSHGARLAAVRERLVKAQGSDLDLTRLSRAHKPKAVRTSPDALVSP